jgi:hypothetical protein
VIFQRRREKKRISAEAAQRTPLRVYSIALWECLNDGSGSHVFPRACETAGKKNLKRMSMLTHTNAKTRESISAAKKEPRHIDETHVA